MDTKVPVPANDITGLSTPAPGAKLVGILARVCSDHGGAIGAYDFGLESSEGDGRLKFPQRNYREAFDARDLLQSLSPQHFRLEAQV